MATTADFIAYVIEQVRLESRLSTRRMFGEYALYIDGKVVGFACDNSLFIKFVDATDEITRTLPAGEAYPGSKAYAMADELLDEPMKLQALLLVTADALPPPKPKKARTGQTTRRSAPESIDHDERPGED